MLFANNLFMSLTLQPAVYLNRKIRQEDANFASFSHIFLRGEEKGNGVLNFIL